jgi:hypothetical protein
MQEATGNKDNKLFGIVRSLRDCQTLSPGTYPGLEKEQIDYTSYIIDQSLLLREIA